MKKTLLLILISLQLFSCSENDVKNQYIKTGNFIFAVGKHSFGKKNIVVKEFKNGSLIFGVSDYKNHLLYQSNMFKPFSKYQYWTIYLDKKENIWFYNSDYQENILLFKDSLSGNYIEKDFFKEKIKMPQKLAKELSRKGVN